MKNPTLARIILPLARNFRMLVAAIFLLTLFFAWGMTRLQIENDIMFMLPDSNRAKNFFLDTQETFGSTTGIVIAIASQSGIYNPSLLDRVDRAGQQILRVNQIIPARRIQSILDMPHEQALVITAYLQNLTRLEGPDFLPDASHFSDRDMLLEELEEATPHYLHGRLTPEILSQTADRLARAMQSDPSLPRALMTAVTRPTDNRGFNRGIWVDQISSLMESDTVWPEFYFLEDMDTFFRSHGFSDTASARKLISLILETGPRDTSAIRNLFSEKTSTETDTGIPPAFFHSLRQKDREDPAFLPALQEAILASPKQIRTGRIYRPESSSLAELRLRLHNWSLFDKGLYNQEENATLLLVKTAPNLNKENKALLLDEVRIILDDVFRDSGFRVHMAGEPVVDNEIGSLMIRDIRWLFPVVSLVVMACLFLMFRNLPGVLYPMLTVMISLVWCFGVMGYTGVPVSIVSSALPVLLVAVGTAYAIHLTHAFQQGQGMGLTPVQLAGRVLNLTGGGVLMAGLTTVAGFASLTANEIVPLRDFGLFIGLGVVFALLLALCLIPALMIRFSGQPDSKAAQGPQPFRPAAALSLFCCRKPRTVLSLFLIIFVLSLTGLSLLRVEMNNITFFKKDAPIRMADTFINDHFAGTTGVSVIFSGNKPGDALDPDVVGVMERLGDHLMAKHDEIGKVISMADFIKKMNQAFFDNDPAWYRLPAIDDLSGEKSTEALHAQYEAYMDKYQRKDTESLMDPLKKEAAISIQMKTACSTAVRSVSNTALAFLQGPEGQILRDRGITTHTTGPGTLYLEANQLIVKGQLWSIAISFVLVFIVVAWIMKSLLYGLFSLIPLAVTIMGTFGIMGFAGIALDVATAITACVAIGIGIDYGIHYLVHYREARFRGLCHEEAILHTASGTGRAIFLNAAAVTSGFLVLLASAFIPLINLGILISITMISAALAAMTLLPAALTLAAGRLHTPGSGKSHSPSSHPQNLHQKGESHAA